MGEEDKKPEEAQKVGEEKKEGGPKAEKPVGDGKKEEKKTEETKAEEKQPAALPPPPQEIVLKVYMHCEGCARKVRRCLKGFEGVEDVSTDCRTSKVVVKGDKADPLKVLERVQKKNHRQVQLISPIPKPQSEEPKKPEGKAAVKVEEKKEEPPVITVVLGVYMHCEACALEIKKRIQKMKGVENAEPDLKSSQVIVKGTFEPEKLTDYVYKRTGKHAVIIKVEPEKKEEKKEGKVEKKAEEGGKEVKKGEEDGKEKKESGGAVAAAGESPAKVVETELDDFKLDLKKNEFYHSQYPQNYQVYHSQYPQNYQVYQSQYPQNYQVYPQRNVHEYPAYPQIFSDENHPQIFSDENPNACSVM